MIEAGSVKIVAIIFYPEIVHEDIVKEMGHCDKENLGSLLNTRLIYQETKIIVLNKVVMCLRLVLKKINKNKSYWNIFKKGEQ